MAYAETNVVEDNGEAVDRIIKLLEDHTILINRLYERGVANFDEAIQLQHLNKRLSRKLRKGDNAVRPSQAH